MITRMTLRQIVLLAVWGCAGCASALALPAANPAIPARLDTPAITARPASAAASATAIRAAAPAPLRWLAGPLAPENFPTPALVAPPATPSVPPTLSIPMLDLTRTVVAAPVNAAGWDVSALDDEVGWLTGTGAHPGDRWGVALTAHASRSNGTAGPFGYLWRVPLHAEIRYQHAGHTYIYQVIDKRWLAPTDTRAVFVPDGDTLLLVTCDGWNFLDQTYTQRLLVVAQRVAAP